MIVRFVSEFYVDDMADGQAKIDRLMEHAEDVMGCGPAGCNLLGGYGHVMTQEEYDAQETA